MTKGKVPATKVDKNVISLTKTQKELFNKDREEINELVGRLNAYMINHTLARRVDDFIEELGIDVTEEDWDFDARKLCFNKREKKEE